ncbi:FadR/GntR family transcriptional regulator [Streptomyces sp. cg40]|uniref:FadR/GntR family transcriptional regulator n=1 Tax=Streptomyces sp. cg40 TaxID=3419764 RepID=UPI003D068955
MLLERAATLKTDRTRLSTRVADLIARTILEEGLPQGHRLPPEREMIEHFGVGRATLREALRILESDGLLRMRMGPAGGPEVSRPEIDRVTRVLFLFLVTSQATLRDIYAVRAAVDPATARLAAVEADPRRDQGLMESVSRMKASVSDERAFLRECETFHRLVAESCRNPMFAAVSLSLHTILDGHEAGVRYSRAALRSVVELHTAITTAIVAGDADAAEEAAADHVRTAVEYFEKKFPRSLDTVLQPSHFPDF